MDGSLHAHVDDESKTPGPRDNTGPGVMTLAGGHVESVSPRRRSTKAEAAQLIDLGGGGMTGEEKAAIGAVLPVNTFFRSTLGYPMRLCTVDLPVLVQANSQIMRGQGIYCLSSQARGDPLRLRPCLDGPPAHQCYAASGPAGL